MFVFKETVTRPDYKLNYIMPYLIRALTRSTIKKAKRKKNKQQNTAKTQNLKLKAPSNNVKLQPNKTPTAQFYFFLITKRMGLCFNETR